MPELRIVDAGTVGTARSQGLWHGIASEMSEDGPPTLSFCIPGGPYVCLGFHRALEEVDLEACRRTGLPVLRRRIGGGPVYLDSDQLFFQITLPASKVAYRLDRLYARLLGPAVAAFRRLGIAARLEGLNEIEVEGRRLSGTGAGAIGAAVTVVGNVIFRFPHARMAGILKLPTETMRGRCLALMRQYVSSLEAEGLGAIGPDDARDALIAAYAEGLGLAPREGDLSGAEEEAVARWEERVGAPEWVGRPRSHGEGGRKVKIRAGVWVFSARGGERSVECSVRDGVIDWALVRAASLHGRGEDIERALRGCPADAAGVAEAMTPFGEEGREMARLLEPGLSPPG